MNETSIQTSTLLSELSAYFVSQYGMTPRDAAGLVMQSAIAEDLRKGNSPLLNASVEQLATRML